MNLKQSGGCVQVVVIELSMLSVCRKIPWNILLTDQCTNKIWRQSGITKMCSFSPNCLTPLLLKAELFPLQELYLGRPMSEWWIRLALTNLPPFSRDLRKKQVTSLSFSLTFPCHHVRHTTPWEIYLNGGRLRKFQGKGKRKIKILTTSLLWSNGPSSQTDVGTKDFFLFHIKTPHTHMIEQNADSDPLSAYKNNWYLKKQLLYTLFKILVEISICFYLSRRLREPELRRSVVCIVWRGAARRWPSKPMTNLPFTSSVAFPPPPAYLTRL